MLTSKQTIHSSWVDACIARSISLPDVMYLTQVNLSTVNHPTRLSELEPGGVVACDLNSELFAWPCWLTERFCGPFKLLFTRIHASWWIRSKTCFLNWSWLQVVQGMCCSLVWLGLIILCKLAYKYQVGSISWNRWMFMFLLVSSAWDYTEWFRTSFGGYSPRALPSRESNIHPTQLALGLCSPAKRMKII